MVSYAPKMDTLSTGMFWGEWVETERSVSRRRCSRHQGWPKAVCTLLFPREGGKWNIYLPKCLCSERKSCDTVLTKEKQVENPKEEFSSQIKRQRLSIRSYGLECGSDAWRSSSYSVTKRTEDGGTEKVEGARIPDDVLGLLIQFCTSCPKLLAYDKYILCLLKPL